MKPIPLSIQTLYSELVQQVHAIVEKPGSVYRRTLKGISYSYAKRSVGTSRLDLFLGRSDDPAVVERIKAIRVETKRAAERRGLVATLRKSNVPIPVKDLGAVLDALADAGLFREAVLVGTASYQCYSPIVGFVLPAAALMTHDADLATASLALSANNADDTLEAILRRADETFRPIPGLRHNTLPSSFRSARGFVFDLLTPQYRRGDSNPMPLEKLAAGAVPLQHLDWLITNPISAVALYGAGVPIRIPIPARYAMHKLIIAQKRGTEPTKRGKDLLQARMLIEALRVTDPWSLADAYKDACAQGRRGWQEPIRRSFAELGLDGKTIAKVG
jgi:hypothetical protein